ETASPTIAPGACFGVLATLSTNDAQAQSVVSIKLTAQSNSTNAVNGRNQDVGTIINTVGVGPRLSDPDNPNQPPASLANGKNQIVLSIGATFTTSIAFKNSGDAAARNIVVTQTLPVGLDFVPDSIQTEAHGSVVKTDGVQP